MAKFELEVIDGVEETPEIVYERLRKRERPKTGSRNLRGDVPLTPFISCTVDRPINVQADDEFWSVVDFQEALGRQNDGYYADESGRQRPRYDWDDYHSTLVRPEALHVRHLYAADVGEIVLRHIANDKGIIKKPKEVAKRITRFTNRYSEDSRRYNERTQDTLLYAKGFTTREPRRTFGDDELCDADLAMLNGIFHTTGEVEPFGRGNAFGLTFDEKSRRFLQAERSRALDMLVGTLGIRHLDSDIENRITTLKHHMTLIRLGVKLPEWELFTDNIDSLKAPLPDTIVTQLDPSARAIIKNDK